MTGAPRPPLAIARNVPLPMIAAFLARLAPTAFVEWVPLEDPMVRQMVANRSDVPDYSAEEFRGAFARHFDVEEMHSIRGSGRQVAIMTRASRRGSRAGAGMTDSAPAVREGRPRADRTAGSSGTNRPLVSICIPTYNGALWIVEAIESALAQDYQRCEVLVCDDASSDQTVELARALRDPRVQVLANETRVGMAGNWNRCVQASSGDYVKFLMQDDRLSPTCVTQMVQVMEAYPDVGLVFSPREIEFEDPDDPESSLWENRYAALHGPLEPLSPANHGRALFNRLRDVQFRHNWIGEPTAVMIRRLALLRVGLFNVRLRQLTDLEMWLRIAFFHDVGFVPDTLATFRVHRRSASAMNERTGTARLDRVWLLEGLRAHPQIRAALGPRIEALIWLYLLRSTVRRLIMVRARTPSQAVDLREYLRFRLGRGRGRLHGALKENRDGSAAARGHDVSE